MSETTVYRVPSGLPFSYEGTLLLGVYLPHYGIALAADDELLGAVRHEMLHAIHRDDGNSSHDQADFGMKCRGIVLSGPVST